MKKAFNFILGFTLFGASLTLSACGSSSSSAASNESDSYAVAASVVGEEAASSESMVYYDDYIEEAMIEESFYDGSVGPLVYRGSIKDGLIIYQYDIESGEKQEVFSFNNDNNYSTTVRLDVNAIPCYQLKQLFSKDMSRMAVQWYNSSDSSRRVGWIDKEGYLTDISEIIHPTTTDFSSVVPDDSSPIFTPDGLFMFSNHNNEKYVFVDVDTQKVVREEDIMHDEDGYFNNPIWDVLFLPNGKMVEVINVSADYSRIDFGEYKVDFHNNGNVTSGVGGYDLIGNAVVVGVGRVNGETSIGKYGEGVTGLGVYNEYSVDWRDPVFEKLTPPTDYRLESCAYNNGQIVFIGTRGEDRFMFIINDGEGEQIVKQIARIPQDEHLLFWR